MIFNRDDIIIQQLMEDRFMADAQFYLEVNGSCEPSQSHCNTFK